MTGSAGSLPAKCGLAAITKDGWTDDYTGAIIAPRSLQATEVGVRIAGFRIAGLIVLR